jgi:hypothetical protein
MGVTQNRAALITLLRTRQRGTGAVEDYIAQMNALGESLRPQTVQAMRVFDSYVALNNLRQYITLALPLASDNFLGFEAALYRPPGFVGITATGFSGADYTRAGGLVSNGVGWINTGLQCSAVASSTTGMLGASILSSAVDVGDDMGAVSGTNFLQFHARWTDSNLYARHFDLPGASVAVADSSGFTLTNRLSNTDYKVWKNGVSIASSAVPVAGTVPTTTIALCARRDSATGLAVNIAVSRVYSGFIIGGGMPDAAIPGFMSAWQTMQAAIRA